MPFDVYIGSFSKRNNSTKRPVYSDWLHLDNVTWKDGLNVDEPVLSIHKDTLSGTGEALNYNYAYIPWTNSYYWINGIQNMRRGLWELSLKHDVLATYRDEILNTSCYIAYGKNEAASGTEYRLQDTRQNVSNVPAVSSNAFNLLSGMLSPEVGCYLLSAVGANSGVSTYAVNHKSMAKLINVLNRDMGTALDSYVSQHTGSTWSPATSAEALQGFSITQSLTQQQAIASIKSCVWVPIAYGSYPNTEVTIYLGDFSTGTFGKPVDAGNVTLTGSVNIPWPVSDWRRMNCQIQVYLPFFGNVAVAADKCNEVSAIDIVESYNYISGEYSISLWAGNYNIYTGTTSLAVPYAIGSSNVSAQQMFAGITTAVGGAISLTGGGAPGAFAGVASVAAGIAQMITPTVQSTGSVGGASSTGLKHGGALIGQATVLYYAPIDDTGFKALYGWPVMKVTKPVAGYCQTVGFPVEVPARVSEQMEIAAFMDGGVFIEFEEE